MTAVGRQPVKMHVNGPTLPDHNIHSHPWPNSQALLSMAPRKMFFLCLYPQVVGLYRLCGSAAVKKELRDAFEQDSAAVCLSEDVYPDINVITGQHNISPLPVHFFQPSPPGWSGGPSEASSLLSDLIFISNTYPLLTTTVSPNEPSGFRSQAAFTREAPLSTGILKDYLRELPTPLITQPLYQVVLEAMAQGHPSRASLGPDGTRGLLSCLPDVERVSWWC